MWPPSTWYQTMILAAARNVRTGAIVGPGRGVQPVADGDLHQLVVGRVIPHVVDPVPVSVVGEKDGRILVRAPAQLLRVE